MRIPVDRELFVSMVEELKKADELLRKFKQSKDHLVVVKNEAEIVIEELDNIDINATANILQEPLKNIILEIKDILKDKKLNLRDTDNALRIASEISKIAKNMRESRKEVLDLSLLEMEILMLIVTRNFK